MARSLSFALAASLAAGLSLPAFAQAPSQTPSQGSGYNSGVVAVPGALLSSPRASWRAGCSTAGWLRLILADGSNYDLYANPGTAAEDGIGILGVAATSPQPAATCVVTLLTNTKR
jgi:hypothetical protein